MFFVFVMGHPLLGGILFEMMEDLWNFWEVPGSQIRKLASVFLFHRAPRNPFDPSEMQVGNQIHSSKPAERVLKRKINGAQIRDLGDDFAVLNIQNALLSDTCL
jgi:hypothetical protein